MATEAAGSTPALMEPLTLAATSMRPTSVRQSNPICQRVISLRRKIPLMTDVPNDELREIFQRDSACSVLRRKIAISFFQNM